MRYLSTRDENITASPSEAIIKGLAPDGGLFIPENLDDIKVDYKELIGKTYKEIAVEIFGKFFPDLLKEIPEIVSKSYDHKFSDERITPLECYGDKIFLELFHGPTCAFKDVALSALPNLMNAALRKTCFTKKILILTATSGDTGSAAMRGFSNVKDTGIIVFYPDDGISEIQRLQMTTQDAPNVLACAIRDNFDAAQKGVKKILEEQNVPVDSVSLSSANSINIGRLVPQVVYYFAAYKELVSKGKIELGDEVSFTVPTGNFGNIMAGWFARTMGLPIKRLVCASNKNDVLTEFLTDGRYDRRREFYKTESPSMDILVSSNLERLLYYVAGPKKTAKYMKDLEQYGEYRVEANELEKIREVFTGCSSEDYEAEAAIRECFEKKGCLIDTHTATAYAGYEKLMRDKLKDDGITNVILATASPFKFPKAVLAAIGNKTDLDDRECMDLLSKQTGFSVPLRLSEVFTKPVKSRDVIDKDEMKCYVDEKIMGRYNE